MPDAHRPDTGYTPDLPREHIERIRQWHEEALHAAREAGNDGQTFDYLGLTLHVPPRVQPITGMSRLLGEAVMAEVSPGDRVLDMGTGCGVNAILAARADARKVLALDVNPEAVRAARDNAHRNGVEDRLEVRLSDVFEALDPSTDAPFDVVVFDPPFRWFRPRDPLEMATADPGYRALTRFMREAKGHLSERGRLLLFFGSSGDLDYLKRLINEEGFETEVLGRESLTKDGWEVEYLTYLLTP